MLLWPQCNDIVNRLINSFNVRSCISPVRHFCEGKVGVPGDEMRSPVSVWVGVA